MSSASQANDARNYPDRREVVTNPSSTKSTKRSDAHSRKNSSDVYPPGYYRPDSGDKLSSGDQSKR